MALHLILNLYSDENTKYIDCEDRTGQPPSIRAREEMTSERPTTPSVDVTIDNRNTVNMEVAGPVSVVIVILIIIIVCLLCKKVTP